ncbi:Flp family type IVb pilin [Dongshaea marina]|uniref:Flp family type IVb pilin n=1 Tax=Dongshaea marina TaxID=2047966 RepID=UPI0018FF829F|nr:Flp family type IVb pilin [Dongshaea marina]
MDLIAIDCRKLYRATSNSLITFIRNERGSNAIEYALIGVAVAGLESHFFGSHGPVIEAIGGLFNHLADILNQAAQMH